MGPLEVTVPRPPREFSVVVGTGTSHLRIARLDVCLFCRFFTFNFNFNFIFIFVFTHDVQREYLGTIPCRLLLPSFDPSMIINTQ